MAKKILLIEDEKILTDLLLRKLTQVGYNVLVAPDGEMGLELMRKEKPDLILLDVVMPKMDGFGVMEEMRQDKHLKNIPVIIISNSGQPIEIDRIKKLGAKDWLIKTEFNPQEVVDKIKKQIG